MRKSMNWKSFIYPMLIASVFITSCNEEELGIEKQEENVVVSLPKYPQSVIEIRTENEDRFKAMLEENFPLSRAGYLVKDSIWPGGGGHSLIYETNEFTLTSDAWRYIYAGSLLRGGSIENQRYAPLANRVEPITISYSFPARWVIDQIDVPSLAKQRQSVQNVMNREGMSGTQLVSFSYNMNQFSYWEELKMEFGCNVNIGTLLDINVNVNKGKIERNTGLVAKFIQRNFTLDMDLPMDGCLLLNNSELQSIAQYDPVYISSLTFGRMGIIIMESNHSYDELSVAVNAAFQAKIVNGSLNISVEHKKILDDSKLSINIIAGDGNGTVKTVQGLDEFVKFLVEGGTYSPQNPGDPIFYTASYLSDNSPLYSRFKINLAN